MTIAATIKMDTGIPIPETRGQSPGIPLATMEVGHSFFVPRTIGSVSSSISHHKVRNPGKNFTVRTVTENGVKGIRIWRIA